MADDTDAALGAVTRDLNGLGSPFLVDLHRSVTTDDGADIDHFLASRLGDPDDDEIVRMVERHAECRGMPVARQVGSLVFQRYSHRVCGVAVAAWIRHGVALDVTAANTRMRFVGGTPDGLEVAEIRVLSDTSARGIVETVVDRHLLPIAEVLAARTGPGLANLWGNMAAGFAGAFQTLSRFHDAQRLREQAECVMNVNPRLGRGGSFRVMEGPYGPRLRFDRASCCHWYAAPDGRYCSWCSKTTEEQRTQRFREIMAEEQR